MLKKVLLISLITSLVFAIISLSVVLYWNTSRLETANSTLNGFYNGQILYSLGNKVYSYDFGKRKKQLITEIVTADYIKDFDYDSNSKRILIVAQCGPITETYIHSKKETKLLDSTEFDILYASFGESTEEYFYLFQGFWSDTEGVITKYPRSDEKYIELRGPFDKAYKPKFSKKLKSLLTTVNENNKQYIYLANPYTDRMQMLFEGFNPSWVIDGETFVYSTDKGYFKYSLKTKKSEPVNNSPDVFKNVFPPNVIWVQNLTESL